MVNLFVMRVFAGHAGGIRSLAVSAAADRVITDGEDGTVRVWDLLSGAELAVLGSSLESAPGC